MIDKKIESDIKVLKGFLEFWGKFHSIYDEIIAKDIISQEDEHRLFETRDMIKNKYEEVKGSLEFKYVPHARLTDPVSEILGIATIRFMSEKNLKKMGDDWRDSYIFLNNILERLKNNKKRMEEFNPMGVFLKRVFNR